VVQQQGLLRQLTRYPNPSAGWVQSASSRRSEGETQGAFISQDIVTAGKLRIAGKAERAEIEWRTLQLKSQTARVLNDVRIRYYEVLGAQQAMDTAAELERLAAEDLKTVGQLLEAKQASRPDVLQAEIKAPMVLPGEVVNDASTKTACGADVGEVTSHLDGTADQAALGAGRVFSARSLRVDPATRARGNGQRLAPDCCPSAIRERPDRGRGARRGLRADLRSGLSNQPHG
jgi:hypothetical protein